MKKYLFEFIPIILCVVFVLFTNKAVEISNSILGKILAVLLIMFYANEDKLYGAIACGLVILYYSNLYVEGLDNIEPIPNPLRKQFEKQYCNKGNLTYKDADVRVEMAQHVFPEIVFEKGQCNPCDKSCDYSIIEEKMKTEQDLRTPKKSDDFLWANMLQYFSFLSGPKKDEPVHSAKIVSEQFSDYVINK